ncbi:MAG TPA: allophanate hydrolase [Polyangia bacterium]|nr:allophanate hydrolase [Polyangia bacterium]
MTSDADPPPLDLTALAARYDSGAATPRDVVLAILADIERRGADGVWISVAARDDLLAATDTLARRRAAGEALPLFGVPFAVKDNIDVAGLPTTAACPAFAYTPLADAAVVARLKAAGAIAIGKVNLDQFATGLVGVRSPYGVPRNPFDARLIPGGSSSGSAVAVANGQVTFALGTDTAGSGRVPAAYGNVVGIKPSAGVLSATGVVPACRSFDCVSIFALTAGDGARVADLARRFDAADPFARPEADRLSLLPAAVPVRFRFGRFAASDLDFCGDERSRAAFDAAVESLRRLGGEPVTVDAAPFREAGTLLYGGPFIAERLETIGDLLAHRPEALRPEIRTLMEQAARHDAASAFAAMRRLRTLRRQAEAILSSVDFLFLPTAPTIYSLAAVAADPLRLNFTLGVYTTFVNLLDLAAVAVPAGRRADGLPFGVTLAGPWGSDGRLAAFADRLHRASETFLGATQSPLAATPAVAPAPLPAATPADLPIVVVGAHLSGQPLHHQLTSLDARFVRAGHTAPAYRLYALAGTTPPKPGLVRAGPGERGAAIEVEVWSLSPAAFGAFVAAVPPPLAIGKVELDDGARVSGFLCEPHAVAGARDISSFGGWRAYRKTDGPI